MCDWKIAFFSGTYPLIYGNHRSFYMRIHYMRAYFWSLSHITRCTCMYKNNEFVILAIFEQKYGSKWVWKLYTYFRTSIFKLFQKSRNSKLRNESSNALPYFLLISYYISDFSYSVTSWAFKVFFHLRAKMRNTNTSLCLHF